MDAGKEVPSMHADNVALSQKDQKKDDSSITATDIFLKIDPILRMLLASIEQYRTELQPLPYLPSSPGEERILGLLRAQTKLCLELQTVWTTAIYQDHYVSSSSSSLSPPSSSFSSDVSSCLVVLADYVLLPLILVLERAPSTTHYHRHATTTTATTTTTTTNGSSIDETLATTATTAIPTTAQRNKRVVRRSEERTCVETAARTLSSFLHGICRHPRGARPVPGMGQRMANAYHQPPPKSGKDDSDNNDDNEFGQAPFSSSSSLATTMEQDASTRLPSKSIVRCLIACATALPMEPSRPSSSKKEEVGSGGSVVRDAILDKGEACTEALFSCIQQLVQHNYGITFTTTTINNNINDNNNAKHLPQQITTALDGALLARIVHDCISILTNPLDDTMDPLTSRKQSSSPDAQLLHQTLQTLQSLTEHVPVVACWRALFPGCFAGLYRFILSQLRRTTHKVTSEAIVTLAQLISLTLNNNINDSPAGTSTDNTTKNSLDNKDTATKNNANVIALDKLRSFASAEDSSHKSCLDHVKKDEAPSHGNNDNNNDDDGDADALFRIEINNRLPAPLSVLVTILSSASSPQVRHAVTLLCRVILLDTTAVTATFNDAISDSTRSIWTRDNQKALERASVECCLALGHDKDERVVSSSGFTLQCYKGKIGLSSWSDRLRSVVAPRIIEVMKELSALSRSARETELRSRIQLIDGYLSLAIRTIDKRPTTTTTRTRDRSTCTAIAAPLATESVSNLIRKTLIDLFDVSFDSIQYLSRISPVAAIAEGSMVLHGTADSFRFRHMTEETATLAKDMVQTLGQALGPKHSAIFVDACIADLLESSSHHIIARSKQELNNAIDTATNTSNPINTEWLHAWVGSAIVANEVLLGAFREKSGTIITKKQTQDGVSQKKKRKQRRILKSLAASILPLITSTSLWSLPTIVDYIGDVISIREPARYATISSGKDSGRRAEVSANVLKGNAAIICSLIGLIGTLADLLLEDTCSLLPIILYPLFEKASSSSNHSQVQQTALRVLNKVASACGKASVSELVQENFDYLFGAMLDQVGTGKVFSKIDMDSYDISYPVSYPGVIEVVLRNAVSETKNAQDRGSLSRTVRVLSIQDRTSINYLVDLVNALTAAFDRNIASWSRSDVNTLSISLSLVRMLDAVVCYLSLRNGMDIATKRKLVEPLRLTPKKEEPWLERLAPFRRNEVKDDEEDIFGKFKAKEGFTTYHEANHTSEETGEGKGATSFVSSDEIEFVNLLIARSCFLLSSGSLKVQIASCDALVHGYEFLGFVGKLTRNDETDQSTMILQSISESWPTIIARLRHISSAILSSEQSSAISLRNLTAKSPILADKIAPKETFLSALIYLIVSFCELSDDFMVGRFKTDVWPIVASLIASIISQKAKRPENSAKARNEIHGRYTLLKTLLNSLARIFGRTNCGPGLSELIPIAGTMIIPLIADDNDDIANAASEALKGMLLIDCDSLWRALVTTSGGHFPYPPLKLRSYGTTRPLYKTKSSDRIEKKAQELIRFINELPELPLL